MNTVAKYFNFLSTLYKHEELMPGMYNFMITIAKFVVKIFQMEPKGNFMNVLIKSIGEFLTILEYRIDAQSHISAQGGRHSINKHTGSN